MQIILLMLKDEDGNVRFLVHPELRAVVQREDLAYIKSLLRDFKERAGLHRHALFRQLSSLEVGPLVTHEVGASPSDEPSSLAACSRFVPL